MTIFVAFLALFCSSIVFASNSILPGEPHSKLLPRYIEIYAHRGGRSLFPENTLPAYREVLALGIDWVDMDIGITKDSVLVVDHDLWLNPDILSKEGSFLATSKQELYKQLSKAPGGLEKNIQPYLVRNLTLQELQEYDAGMLNPKAPYTLLFPNQKAIPGTPIPTLQQVVDEVEQLTHNQAFFQIEIKNNPNHPDWTVSPEEFATKLDAFLRKNQLSERVEIQSFDWKPLLLLHKLNPKVKLAFLVEEQSLPRMLDPNPKKAGLWSDGHLLKDYHDSLPQMIKALGGSCYEPEDLMLTKKDLEEAHRLGLKVVVWNNPEKTGVAFDPTMIKKLMKWGVDGIITDDPQQLKELFKP
ncbi:MAG: hypothetical protein K2W99_01585 [Chthoniobacterales bacterium]|nr:hypothetical protein [Chthoniobacterales bacterium]